MNSARTIFVALPLAISASLSAGGGGRAWAADEPAPAAAAAESPAPAPSPPASPPTSDAQPAAEGEIPETKEPEPPPPSPVAPPPTPAPPEPASATAGAAPPAATPIRPPVTAKFSAEIYGFVELDAILDTTQSFNEGAGNGVLLKRDAFGGHHKRLTFGVRNSRIGFKLKGPESESHDIKSSAILEMDFLGNQPSGSEASFFNNPTFRIRHMAAKLETPALNFLAGQYWQLFGWQSSFHPNTVEIQGLPGQVYSRTAQFRVSHSFKTDAITLDLAAAAARSPQRDSALPDAHAGVRLLFNRWKGLRTAGATGTSIDSAGIGISGVYRHFRVAEFASPSINNVPKDGGGLSLDAILPIAPATAEHKENALTLTGSFVTGTGIADLFTGLTGGIALPALPNPTMASPAPTYTSNIDPGLVIFTGAGTLHTIDWQAVLVGLQYYLPPSGNVWISANYSHLGSRNIDKYAIGSMAAKVYKSSDWADANLFVDVNKAIRVGAELAWFHQRFVDDSTARNWRGQISGFYIF